MKSLLLILSISLVYTLQAQTVGVWRGSTDIQITKGGVPGTNDIYYNGVGIGTVLDAHNFGAFTAGDLVTITDPYLFSYENNPCDVATATATVEIASVFLPSVRFTIGTVPFTYQTACGQPGARFNAEGGGCHALDEEWGAPAASITFDPATLASSFGITSGDAIIYVRWEVTFTGANCNAAPHSLESAALASIVVPFPVELVNFDVTASSQGAELAWSTASETNNAGFMIERSLDGNTWSDLDFVPALSQEVGDRNYTYTDSRASEGLNYYRLRQIDHNGTFEHSAIRSAEISKRDVSFILAPNPAGDYTVLRNAYDEVQQFALLSSTGQVMAEYVLGAGELRRLDLSALGSGLYVVRSSQNAFRLMVR